MSKTLSNILTVFKVAKVIAKIAYIFAIIGAVGALVGLGSLALSGVFVVEFDIYFSYFTCINGFAACVGSAILLFRMEKYFAGVLRVGTPFTFDGAKEIFRLGIGSLILSAAVSLVAVITAAIINLVAVTVAVESDLSISVSVVGGLTFMFLSVVFKHGAELKEAASDTSEEQTEEIHD